MSDWEERHSKGGWAQPQDKLGDPRGTWKANVLHVDKSYWKRIRHLLRVPRKVSLKEGELKGDPGDSMASIEPWITFWSGWREDSVGFPVPKPWIVYSSVFYCRLGWRSGEMMYTECLRRLKTLSSKHSTQTALLGKVIRSLIMIMTSLLKSQKKF